MPTVSILWVCLGRRDGLFNFAEVFRTVVGYTFNPWAVRGRGWVGPQNFLFISDEVMSRFTFSVSDHVCGLVLTLLCIFAHGRRCGRLVLTWFLAGIVSKIEISSWKDIRNRLRSYLFSKVLLALSQYIRPAFWDTKINPISFVFLETLL